MLNKICFREKQIIPLQTPKAGWQKKQKKKTKLACKDIFLKKQNTKGKT